MKKIITIIALIMVSCIFAGDVIKTPRAIINGTNSASVVSVYNQLVKDGSWIYLDEVWVDISPYTTGTVAVALQDFGRYTTLHTFYITNALSTRYTFKTNISDSAVAGDVRITYNSSSTTTNYWQTLLLTK